MESVERNLELLSAAKVLVVGDIMLDRYWFGAVDRVSPEAPVPVVAVNEIEERIGGAGNVAANVCALGGTSCLLGITGHDEAGEAIAGLVRERSIQGALQTDKTISTTLKLRVIARNQQLLRADFEQHPAQEVVDGLLEAFEEKEGDFDVVVFSDYGKGALSDIEKMIDIAIAQAVPVLVDPKGSTFDRYRGATVITPNLKEFAEVVGTPVDQDDMAQKAYPLLERLGIKQVLVTLSEQGMVLFAGGSCIHQPAKTLEVYDVSGAGDTVIAVMAMAVAAGLSDQDSLDMANTAAGVVVSKLGTATLGLDELQDALLDGN